MNDYSPRHGLAGLEGLAGLADRGLDRSVVLGFSRLGLGMRRRLAGWPADPVVGALAGRSIAVTGATSGLGTATARQLVALGAHVHLVVRDVDKGQATAAELDRLAGAPRSTVWRCDVGDLESVRSFGASFVGSGARLDGLIHNAGVMPPKRTESAQGHELSLAVHVLGPVLMTDLLLPVMVGGDARVVFVTSGGMYTQGLHLSDLEYLDEPYAGPTAYARSKRVQIELLPMLQKRWAAAGLTVYATHPGWAATPGVSDSLPTFARLTGPILRSADEGADTTTWLMAVQPAPPGGGLWHDRAERPTTFFGRNAASTKERAALERWLNDTLAE